MVAALFDSTVWAALLAALVAGVSSVLFLRTRHFFYDSLALATTEIGLIVLGAGIVAGAAAGHSTAGLWWTWNPRLTVALVCWLLYVPYLMLRGAIEEPTRRATSAAIVSILAAFDVPVIALAVNWWQSRRQHPPSGMEPGVWWILVPLLLIGLGLTSMRVRHEQARRARDAERRVSQEI
jgi:heme exporter protein C